MGKRRKPSRGSQLIAFVGCSKSKSLITCRASEMYKGTLFKKSLCFCKQNFDDIYILSAKYGLLLLEEQIEPYDVTLKDLKESEKRKWGINVLKRVKKLNLKQPIYVYTGIEYIEPLTDIKLITPLNGLGLGERLNWFDKRIKKKGGFNL